LNIWPNTSPATTHFHKFHINFFLSLLSRYHPKYTIS